MSLSATTARPAFNERTLLLTLAAIQFTHIMDFMIMMPLGAGLMRVFNITPSQFSVLVASYGLSAAVFGFLGGFVLDRFERKNALLTLYAGFSLATLACALAPSYGFLLIARIAAGACGGVAGSVLTAMVGDAIPPERRGRAMGTVMTAFPLASVLGVPIGLLLAGWFQWHAPFFMLSALSAVIFFVALRVLPHVASHRSDAHPVRQMLNILKHRIHVRGFLLSSALVFGGGCMIPFLAPSMVANVGLTEKQLPLMYLCGGALTFFTMPWFGRMSDRHDKLHVLAWISGVAAIVALIVTRLGVTPIPIVLVVTTLFFIAMSGRYSPAMALITNAVEARYRGGFMSVNSAVQQAASGLASIIAGRFITSDSAGHLSGFPRVGILAVAAFLLTVVFAAWLRAAAPHAAKNPTPVTSPLAEPAA
ncbi:MAG: MFS transporter [Opitutaceae bacterium]|nr:MFS transporter [Opitutaceae bacterium]MBP9912807.1 MFS transporter [Opitutaceae bacterium]